MLTSGTCSGNHRASTRAHSPVGYQEATTPRLLSGSAKRAGVITGTTAPDQAVLPAAPGVSAAVFQVGAGREHRRRAGDDAGPQFVIVVEQVERLVNAVGSDPVNGVALGLTLDADDEDPPRRS